MNAKRPKKIDVIKKQALKVGYITILSTILFLGISYAWLSLTLSGTKTNVLRVGTLSLVLDDTIGEGIAIDKGLPIVDEEGLTQIPYIFTLTNNGDIESEYTIYLDDVDLLAGETRLPDHAIKYSLLRDGSELGLDLLSTTGENPNRILDTGIIAPGETYTYELRLWLDINAGNDTMGQVFRGKIRVEATQVVEPIPTDLSCFVYTKSSTSVTITDYKCYEGNPDGMPVITDVAIPRLIEGMKVTKIDAWAFKSKWLTSVDIPISISSFGWGCFQGNNLKELTILNPDANLEAYSFSNNQINTLQINSNIKSIGARVFAYNKLTKVVISDNVTSIGEGAFSENELVDVKIGNGLNSLSGSIFSGNNLTSVIIPENIKTIGDWAFNENLLTSVKIPSSVVKIGNNAFSANKLTEITIPSNVMSIGNSAFGSNKSISNSIKNVIIKGKSSTADFTSFGTSVFSWASGYSDANITWQP